MSAGTIGIIGAGHIAQAFARVGRRAGRDVVIANSRGPKSLASVVAALGEEGSRPALSTMRRRPRLW
jgi:predicted dinucleotide-binding enzyme